MIMDYLTYIKKLTSNELGYRRGKLVTGQMFLISKHAACFFPPLKKEILNDQVKVRLKVDYLDQEISLNLVYHNDRHNTPNGSRDEYRIYLNNKLAPTKTFFEPNDLVSFQFVEQGLYKFQVFKPDSLDYKKVQNLYNLNKLQGQHALVPVTNSEKKDIIVEKDKENKTEKVNAHIEKLHRYLPFSPIMEQIYEEYSQTKDSIDLDTVALRYLLKIVRLKKTKIVVLTGDAGHGKTHLCRRLLEVHLNDGSTEDKKFQALKLINTSCDGNASIEPGTENQGVKSLCVYKDFSEFSVELASEYIEKAGTNEKDLTVICANEGRLRAVLEAKNAGEYCKRVANDFKLSFQNGLASQDGEIHIINLNYQSVAASLSNEDVETSSLLERTLKLWVDGTRWRSCDQCSSKASCPIYHNHFLLSHSKNKLGLNRQKRLVDLFATAERLGVVVTIREMLMSVSYMLTGGLTCRDVHKNDRDGKQGWQNKYAFYNLVFEAPNNDVYQKLSKIPVVGELSKLDPGKVAKRDMDESLINEHDIFGVGEVDLLFRTKIAKGELIDAARGIDEIIGNPRSRKERDREADFIIKILRSLRRRYFFDTCDSLNLALEHMGFSKGSYFIDILSQSLDSSKFAPLKNKIISGLHMIQGLKLSSNETKLILVDPAFGNATANAAIIARKIASGSIKIIPMIKSWSYSDEQTGFAMTKAVDWIDRHIIVRISESDGSCRDLNINLMLFDFLMRAAEGYVGSKFYAHDIRKITNYLGCLAEIVSNSDQEINLFKDGGTYSISIDDGVIQVGAN